MDINITELVSSAVGGITKTASIDNISSAEALIAKLSKGGKVDSNEVLGVIQGLVQDVRNLKKREKITALVEDMVNFSQIDESDIESEIEKFASLDNDEIELEKKALHLSINNYTSSSLFTKTSGHIRSGKQDLDSFLI